MALIIFVLENAILAADAAGVDHSCKFPLNRTDRLGQALSSVSAN
jgi:hypothetical protein